MTTATSATATTAVVGRRPAEGSEEGATPSPSPSAASAGGAGSAAGADASPAAAKAEAEGVRDREDGGGSPASASAASRSSSPPASDGEEVEVEVQDVSDPSADPTQGERPRPRAKAKAVERRVEAGDVREGDVLLGRNCGNNLRYKELVESERDAFRAGTTAERTAIVSDVMDRLKAQDPPARFLKPHASELCWIVVEESAARQKVAGALRAGGKKAQVEGGDDGDATNAELGTSSADDSMRTEKAEDGASRSGDQSKKSTSCVNSSRAGPRTVRPHDAGSAYGDVLGFFAATPFDAEVMAYLHAQKRGKVPKLPRRPTLLPSRANLPILPQKVFASQRALDAATDRADDDVAKFLVEEGRNAARAEEAARAEAARAEKKRRKRAAQDARTGSLHRIGSALKSAVATPAKGARPAPKAVAATSVSDDAARMAAAFGFGGAAKRAAEDGTKAPGASASKKAKKGSSGGGGGLRVSLDGNVRVPPPGPVSLDPACRTPKAAKAPSGSGGDGGTTPKTPRTPATLLSTEPASSLPEGWTKKTFRRNAGKTAGTTDVYFFSPGREIKFRSVKGCKAFLALLVEEGVDGDENKARKLYKERGHKF